MRGKYVIRLIMSLASCSVGGLVWSAPPSPDTTITTIPLQEFQVFAQAIDEIKSHYVHEIKDEKLFQNAIRGMLENLDPHSALLDEEEFEELRINTAGEFSGLGIEVSFESGGLRVITPLDDSPAMKVGIQTGDLITHLDGTPVQGLKFKEAIKKMRGLKGSSATLTVIRKPALKPMRFKVLRAPIRMKSVKSEFIAPAYGYVKLTQFQDETPSDLKKALFDLEKTNGKPLKGLILDLRNNPGGILDAAIAVSDLFLDQQKVSYDGLIVFTKGRASDSQIQAKASGADILRGAPLVVLINEGSASAAEIVAGAMQDQNRAILLGQKSFGKGSVQTVLPLGEKQAIKITTALYYTPSGKSIQAEGIIPDIEVEAGSVSKAPKGTAVFEFYEKDLKGHLKNEGNQVVESPRLQEAQLMKRATLTEALQERLRADLQLREAFNVIQALQLARK